MAYFEGTNANETYVGTVGADQIYGKGGNDTLNGLEGANIIWGGDGNDTIKTGKGRDIIYGEDGDDLIQVIGNWSGTYVVGGYGADTVSLDKAKAGTLLSLDYDLRYDLGGGDPFDEIDVTIRNGSMAIDKTDSSSSTFRDNVDGLAKLGSEGTIMLFGTRGDDFIDATARSSGPMVIFHAHGNDTFDGSADAYEAVVLAPSSYYSSANPYEPYNDIIITTSSGGQMNGRAVQTQANNTTNSTDTFTVRFSDMDMIEGSTGNDVATGSSGDDKFRPGYGNDGFDGKGGIDTVYYDAKGIISTTVDLQYKYGEALFSNDAFYEDYAGAYAGDRFVFEDQLQYDGLRNVENVVGTDAGSDILRGNAKANVLNGGGGDDALNGRKGHDTLIGGDGDDHLRGFAGRDKFQFDGNDGNDRVYKFVNGEDKFVLEGGLTFADVSVTDQGRHALITFEDTSVLVLNTDHTLIGQNDFLVI